MMRERKFFRNYIDTIIGLIFLILFVISIILYWYKLLKASKINHNSMYKIKVSSVYSEISGTYINDSLFIPHATRIDDKIAISDYIINVGDSLYKEKNNDTIILVKKDTIYKFILLD